MCLFQGPSLKNPMVLGKLINGLYKLDVPFLICNYVSPSISVSDAYSFTHDVSSVCNVAPNCSFFKLNKMDVVWHFRLGHILFLE